MAIAFLLPVRCLLMIEALNANQLKVSFSKGYGMSVPKTSIPAQLEEVYTIQDGHE